MNHRWEDQIYDMASEWDLRYRGEMILEVGDFKRHVERRFDDLKDEHDGNITGERNVERKRLMKFCDEKSVDLANTWLQKKEQNKITYPVNDAMQFLYARQRNNRHIVVRKLQGGHKRSREKLYLC